MFFTRLWGGVSLLGRLAAVLVNLGVVLGRSWAVLWRSLGGLGVVLGGQIGTALGKKIVQKSDQHLRWPPAAILNRFWVVWGSIWDGFGIDLDGIGIDVGRFSDFFIDFLEGAF